MGKCMMAVVVAGMGAWHAAAAGPERAAVDFWRNQSIHQVLTDRYFNGDASNDDAKGRHAPGRPWGAHGGDFAGMAAKLDHIRSTGATAVWISPFLYNANGAYHGYATTDFYRINPAFGTLEELRNFVAEAHRRGMLVVADVVVNHGGHLVEGVGGDWPEFRAPPGGYELRMRGRYAPPFDHEALGVEPDEIFHNHGAIRDWNDARQVELGELMGLDDFRTSSPHVRESMAEIFAHWIRETGVDAFRIDTVKHVEKEFWEYWTPRILEAAREAGKEHFFLFGEVLSDSDALCGSYTGRMGGGAFKMHSVLDYPLYYRIGKVFAEGTGAPSLLAERHGVEALYDPVSRGGLVTFIDNHDVPRFLHGGEATVDRLELALVFLHTAPGIPCVYYGTGQDFDGGRDPFNRENMFDGAFEQGPSEGDNFDMTSPRHLLIARLNNLRRLYPALRTGDWEFLEAETEGPGLLAYTRSGDEGRVLVVMNTSEAPAVCGPLPAETPAGSRWMDALDPSHRLEVDGDGMLPAVEMEGGAFRILVPEEAVGEPDPLVIACTPSHDSGGNVVDGVVEMVFDRPMDRESVEAAFATSPQRAGHFEWADGGGSVVFRPAAKWPEGETVGVRLAESARSATGRGMHAPFHSHFHTNGTDTRVD
jgi:alpha-amylase